MPRLKTHTSGCKKCCCEACESRVKMVGKCCICLPQRICVELLMDEDENDVGCDTDGYDCDCRTAKEVFTVNCQGEYVGTVSCGGLSVDLRFVFEKNEYDECELCMYSDCLLGEGYKECVAADSYGEPGCCGPFATWEVDASDCGNENCGTATVTTSEYPHVKVQDETGFCCSNCECLCECLCLVYTRTSEAARECIATARTCWGSTYGEWTADLGCDGSSISLTITIEEDSYGECSVKLTGKIDGESIESESIALSQCPDMSVEFSATLDNYDVITIYADCQNCLDCQAVDVNCCPDRRVPTSLTFQAVSTDLCSADDTIPLSLIEWSPLDDASPIAVWQGTGNICYDEFEVTLTCIGGAWELETKVLTADDGCFDSGGSLSPLTTCCDPFELTFVNVGGECASCCEPGGTFDGVVTE